MAYEDKPKRKKDDMGNKGRKGKGPKPMKVPRKVRKESAKQERKNLLTENPVVNRSNDSGFDYTQSKKDIKKRYKKMDKGGSAPAIGSIPHGSVSRFVGSTKKLGNTEAMNAMMKGKLKEGLAADLGSRLAKATGLVGTTVSKMPSMVVRDEKTLNAPKGYKATVMPEPKMPKAIKQPLAKKITNPVAPGFPGPLIEMSPSFKPSKRDMELKSAHLSEYATPKAANAKGPKPQKPKSKSRKPKGRLKRKIKGKF